VVAAGSYETVYNIRVADFATYFVGCEEWGFSVWAHNEYGDTQHADKIRQALHRADLPDEVHQRIQAYGKHRYVDGETGNAWADHWTPAELRAMKAKCRTVEEMMDYVDQAARRVRAPGQKPLLEQIDSVTPKVEYTRSAYGNPMNSTDMTALKNANHGKPCPNPTCGKPQIPASPEHDPALGIHWFLGDGRRGKPGILMTQLEREAYAASAASARTTLCVSCNKAGGNAVSAQVDALTRQYIAGTLPWQQQGLWGWKPSK
jgi:hypothetical protein